MDYITEKEHELHLSLIDKYKAHCENLKMPCAICGEKSTTYVYSIFGSYKWYMCENHSKATTYHSAGGMGVMINGQPVDMKFLAEQIKIINHLKNL